MNIIPSNSQLFSFHWRRFIKYKQRFFLFHSRHFPVSTLNSVWSPDRHVLRTSFVRLGGLRTRLSTHSYAMLIIYRIRVRSSLAQPAPPSKRLEGGSRSWLTRDYVRSWCDYTIQDVSLASQTHTTSRLGIYTITDVNDGDELLWDYGITRSEMPWEGCVDFN